MTKLTYADQIREEFDDNIINTLVRKGWIIIPAPIAPPAVEMTAGEIQNSLDFENAVLLSEQKAVARKIITDQIDAGYSVQPEDFVLGLSEYDRTAFTQMLLLVREALDLGLISNSDSQTISDKTGEKHSLTTERFRQIMISYGMFYKSLWDQLV
jgi:hypothetical protein